MQSVVFAARDQVSVQESMPPQPATGEVVIALRAAALNHRDLWIKLGQYAGVTYPCVAGSDGAGVVCALGSGVDSQWLGREVIINPSFDWGAAAAAQGTGFTILGLPRAGTLAEQIAVPVTQLAPRPAHLHWPQAAALPLAGLTAYRALFTRAGLKSRERVLITGVGGGVATLALQFALAAGAKVWVTSRSAAKLNRARALGAEGGFNYQDAAWTTAAREEVSAGFDVILDSAGGAGFSALPDLAAPAGRIVFFGATCGDPSGLALRKIFWRQLSLLGTTMGSPEDWAQMLAWVERHRIVPVVSDVLPLAHAAEAFTLMQSGGQFGKIVLHMPAEGIPKR